MVKHKKLFVLLIPFALLAIILLRPAQKEMEEKIREKIAEVKGVHLVFSQWWEDDVEKGVLQSIVKEFEERNPGISVELDFRSYQEIRDLAFNGEALAWSGEAETNAGSNREQAASGKTDIIAVDPLWIYELAEWNRLEPLGGYMKRSQPRTAGKAVSDESGDSSEGPSVQASATDYTQWTLPLVSFIHPLFYNIDILKNAGFNRPPKTWNEFRTYARAVNNPAAGRFGMAFALSPENPYALFGDIFPWIWASGILIYQNGAPNFSGRALTETLEYLGLLFEEGLVSPNSFLMNNSQKLDEFMKGRIGMMTASIEDMDRIRQSMGGSFGITTIPVPDNYAGKPVFGLSGWSVGILRQSSDKNEAWTFISFLAERKAEVAGCMVPGNGSRSGTGFAGDELYEKAWDMYEASDGIEEFAGKPRVREFEAIVREELEALFEGRFQNDQGSARNSLKAAETITAIQKRWETALQQ
ncbi:MAG: extracellular solute-binding protein [Treponema sp.]|jgi:multiple sugar transport system substrate-binding protein|nr:extracellular solute-binding protein [Treponema sp.]